MAGQLFKIPANFLEYGVGLTPRKNLRNEGASRTEEGAAEGPCEMDELRRARRVREADAGKLRAHVREKDVRFSAEQAQQLLLHYRIVRSSSKEHDRSLPGVRGKRHYL